MSKLLLSAVVLMTWAPAWAQDAAEILKRTAATYQAMNSYDIVSVEERVSRSATNASTSKSEQRRAGAAPGLFRQEMNPPGMLIVMDGTHMWQYSPVSKEYTKRQFPGQKRGVHGPEAGIHQRVQSARVVRQDTVDLETGPVVCTVVEVLREPFPAAVKVPEPLPELYWIDLQRNLVLKYQRLNRFEARNGQPGTEQTTTTTVRRISVNQPVSASLFQFTPPEGAKEVPELTFRPPSSMEGAAAPQFSFTDTGGRTYTNAALQGSVVLLIFATGTSDWLPYGELLYRVFGKDGLVVLVIQPEYTRQTAAQLQADGFTVPLVRASQETLKGFEISSGIALIGRDGTFLHHEPGWGSSTPRTIQRLLHQAGIW